MSLVAMMQTARQGMASELRRVDRAAGAIANGGGSSRDAAVLEGGDLAGSPSGGPDMPLLDLLQAEQSFAANAKVFETGADLWELIGSIKRGW